MRGRRETRILWRIIDDGRGILTFIIMIILFEGFWLMGRGAWMEMGEDGKVGIAGGFTGKKYFLLLWMRGILDGAPGRRLWYCGKEVLYDIKALGA